MRVSHHCVAALVSFAALCFAFDIGQVEGNDRVVSLESGARVDHETELGAGLTCFSGD